MHAGQDENHPLCSFPVAMQTLLMLRLQLRQRLKNERFLWGCTTAVLEAVVLTRKWDFQEEETGSENEVTC